MATLKYKTPEGEWKKVSIGGGGSTEEVYVGSDEPTDENVKVWIDPTGTPSGGNGGSSESGGNGGAEYIVLDLTNPQSIIDAYIKVKAASEGTADAPSLYLLGENMLHPVLECSIENGFEIDVIMDGKLAKVQFDVITGDIVGVDLGDEYNFLVSSTDDAIKAQNLKVVARAGATSLPTYRKFISNSEGYYYDYYQILALVKDTTITEEGQRIYLFTIMDNDLGLLTLYIYDDGSIRTI